MYSRAYTKVLETPIDKLELIRFFRSVRRVASNMGCAAASPCTSSYRISKPCQHSRPSLYITRHFQNNPYQTPRDELHDSPLVVELPSFCIYSTRMMTFHCNAPASLIAHARHPRFLRLMMAFHPFCAQMARTRISMSEPNWRFRDSKCICAAAGKLPLRWTMLYLDVRRSRVGDMGVSGAMLVMQSMTSTRSLPFREGRLVVDGGAASSSSSGTCCLLSSSETCITV